LPTVHLSLPDRLYRQLKEKAAELGIQVTDLIKVYISRGLRGGFEAPGAMGEEALQRLSEKVEALERKVNSQRIVLEGRYKEMEELVRYVLERLEMLEEIVEGLTRPPAKVEIE
jgi:hypothetical protein